MRLLLDTHVWIWRASQSQRVSTEAERAMAARTSTLYLSPITVWETLVLARKGRVALRPSPSSWVLDTLRRTGATTVPLSTAIALRSETLDGLASRDPADRFLAATAIEHDLVLVTADEQLRAYAPLATLW